MGLLNDIFFLESPQLPQLVAFFASAMSTDMEFKTTIDLAMLAGRKLTAMKTTPQFLAMQNLFMQYSIDLVAIIDFSKFLIKKVTSPDPPTLPTVPTVPTLPAVPAVPTVPILPSPQA
jgi:hypothetical protein